MPQVQHDPGLADLVNLARTDGFKEVASTQGHGVLVVSGATRDTLVAEGGGVNEVNTISAHATTPATAGTFTLTVDGQTTATIAFNADHTAVQSALEALSNVAPGDVTASMTSGANLGVAAAVCQLTWGAAFAGKPVTITAAMGGLTGNQHVLATPTPGGKWYEVTPPGST